MSILSQRALLENWESDHDAVYHCHPGVLASSYQSKLACCAMNLFRHRVNYTYGFDGSFLCRSLQETKPQPAQYKFLCMYYVVVLKRGYSYARWDLMSGSWFGLHPWSMNLVTWKVDEMLQVGLPLSAKGPKCWQSRFLLAN
jgi:hypothetical protein